jgi:hypothetical protein
METSSPLEYAWKCSVERCGENGIVQPIELNELRLIFEFWKKDFSILLRSNGKGDKVM